MHKQIQTEITKLMQKDMDRRDFLKHVGIGFAGLIGITGILKTLANLSGSHEAGPSSFGYGANTYGGKRPSNSQPR